MPTIFKAAVLKEFQSPLEMHQYPLPTSLEPLGALVRVEMAGGCGTDIHLWKGQLPIPRPNILGHETVGRIERLGDSLNQDWTGLPLEVGDRITWSSSLACGQCSDCRQERHPTRRLKRKA